MEEKEEKLIITIIDKIFEVFFKKLDRIELELSNFLKKKKESNYYLYSGLNIFLIILVAIFLLLQNIFLYSYVIVIIITLILPRLQKKIFEKFAYSYSKYNREKKIITKYLNHLNLLINNGFLVYNLKDSKLSEYNKKHFFHNASSLFIKLLL